MPGDRYFYRTFLLGLALYVVLTLLFPDTLTWPYP